MLTAIMARVIFPKKESSGSLISLAVEKRVVIILR
jgi:hypothetical protein